MGPAIAENPYHHHTIRTSLTRNLHACFPEVRDEIACAFDDVLQLHDFGEEMLTRIFINSHNFYIMRVSEWKFVPMLPTIMAVVARVSNRIFVGLPLCMY